MMIFKPEIPEGKQIYYTFMVAGLHLPERRKLLHQFTKGTNHQIYFLFEPFNKHDTNAIQVIAEHTKTTSFLFLKQTSKQRSVIGYIPRAIAKTIVDLNLFSIISPRPMAASSLETYGDFEIQIIGPKDTPLKNKFQEQVSINEGNIKQKI